MNRTTDNQNEIFDLVDDKDNVVGQATRGEVHGNKKLIHRSVGVAVFNSSGEIFLQQRSATKDTDPLKWTISASGHVMAGDSYEITAIREINEELGLDLTIQPVCKYLCPGPYETEIVMLYKTTYDGLFKLNKEEIIQGKFFTRKQLKEAVEKRTIELSFMGKVALEKVEWG